MEKLHGASCSNAEKPSFASVAGTLSLTTSKFTGRYDEGKKVEPHNMTINAGIFSLVPSYLPPQWSAYTHPEGQLYFFKEAPIRVVTEAYVFDTKVLEKVEHWAKAIEEDLIDKKVVVPEDVELFIRINDNDCSFYLVDHRSRTIFWVDTLDANEMGITPAASPSHLMLALHELYWNHVEYFPVHLKALDSRVLEELISVFSHALAGSLESFLGGNVEAELSTDEMTSRNSTFPYNAQECKVFLKLLRLYRDQPQDGHARCVIGRLWSLVFKHRFETHYGEQHARLSRDQSILVDTAKESRSVHAITSLLSFKTSDYYLSKLNDIYVDHLVYEHQWIPFMQTCLRDWKSLSYLSLLTAISCLHFNSFLAIYPLALLSALCFGVSFISSILLVHRHEPLENGTATDAYLYLTGARSDTSKFQWLSFMYALPKTFFFWGLLVFLTNGFTTGFVHLMHQTWFSYYLAISGFCLLAVLALQRKFTFRRKFFCLPSIWRRIGSPEEKGEILPV